jgi:acyl-CoA thioesterase
MSFASDTAVEQIGPLCFGAELHDRWSSLVGIHGGYAAAVVARAVELAVDHPTRVLRTMAVQFAAPPRPGAAEVEVTIERAGATVTATSARLLQEGRVLLVAHALSSPSRTGLEYDELVRPRPPDPGDAPIFVPTVAVSHFQNAEVRLDPDVMPFGGGDDAWVAAWLRPLDGEAIDAAWLVAMCDMLPPAVFSRTTGPVKAASLEYVVHIARRRPALPAGDHVYLSCRSPLSTEGFAVEDATMWGPDGSVLAVARQTRLAG